MWFGVTLFASENSLIALATPACNAMRSFAGRLRKKNIRLHLVARSICILTPYTPVGYIGQMEDKILVRLKRIRGQVEGIIKMYEECRECSDVVTQIAAVRAALGAVGKELLTNEAVACVREKKSSKLDKLLKQLFDIT